MMHGPTNIKFITLFTSYDTDICPVHYILIVMEGVTLIKNKTVCFKHNSTFLNT